MTKWSCIAISMSLAATAAVGLPMLPSTDISFLYEGYSWETDALGGYPPAGGAGQAGNVLNGIGEVLAIRDDTGSYTVYDPDDDGAEMTFNLYGLVSQGVVVKGPDLVRTDYVGGAFDIYLDYTPDYSPATGPGTYSGVTDGTVVLACQVQSFYTLYNTALGIGSFAGTFQVVGGEAASELAGEVITWGGSSEAAVPEGWTYMHRIKGIADGEIIPEPSTMAMLGAGLAAVAGLVRRRG